MDAIVIGRRRGRVALSSSMQRAKRRQNLCAKKEGSRSVETVGCCLSNAVAERSIGCGRSGLNDVKNDVVVG